MKMASQRFCLRWNNHQSNMLTVFDQLLHAETFTDVTLAVEGQYLKAHKMVLSACSPYFNALFINHDEKHPIVILKDVPYTDMKSLLDFMYRGEVSVDQERLTAFLRVAETLRIKGLTEVNDDKPITNNNNNNNNNMQNNNLNNSNNRAMTSPPPQLHRIQPQQNMQQQSSQQQQQQNLQQAVAAAQRQIKISGNLVGNNAGNNSAAAAAAAAAVAANNLLTGNPNPAAAAAAAAAVGQNIGLLLNSPLLGSALSGPKRKRGRPRKLSGSSNGTGNDYDEFERDNGIQGSPDVLDARIVNETFSGNEGSDDNVREASNNEKEEPMDTSSSSIKSKENSVIRKDGSENNSSECLNISNSELTQRLFGTKSTDNTSDLRIKIRINPSTQNLQLLQQEPPTSSNNGNNISNANNLLQQQLRTDNLSSNNNNINAINQQSNQQILTESIRQLNNNIQKSNENDNTTLNLSSPTSTNSLRHHYMLQLTQNSTTAPVQLIQKLTNDENTNSISQHQSPLQLNDSDSNTTGNISINADLQNSQKSTYSTNLSRSIQRRRIRRKPTSALDDQAEHLTEMSVRGLDLFRYASINDGVYQCIECAKDNVQRTFKNKYSFQRHAFLYHEGKHRKVFPCPQCGKEFSRPDKMKNHMKTTHEGIAAKESNYNAFNYLMTNSAQNNNGSTNVSNDLQKIFKKIDNNNVNTQNVSLSNQNHALNGNNNNNNNNNYENSNNDKSTSRTVEEIDITSDDEMKTIEKTKTLSPILLQTPITMPIITNQQQTVKESSSKPPPLEKIKIKAEAHKIDFNRPSSLQILALPPTRSRSESPINFSEQLNNSTTIIPMVQIAPSTSIHQITAFKEEEVK